MTNNEYMHILGLLNKENRENKILRYSLVGFVCLAGVAIYYHNKLGRQIKLVRKIQSNLDISNANIKREKNLNQYISQKLKQYQDLNKQAENEKTPLDCKLAEKESIALSTVKV